MGVHTASPTCSMAPARLLRLLVRPRDVPVLCPLIEREILWRLLWGPQGGARAPDRPGRQPLAQGEPAIR